MGRQYNDEMAEEFLKCALDVAADDEAQFHIRQALQQLPNENPPEENRVFGSGLHD